MQSCTLKQNGIRYINGCTGTKPCHHSYRMLCIYTWLLTKCAWFSSRHEKSSPGDGWFHSSFWDCLMELDILWKSLVLIGSLILLLLLFGPYILSWLSCFGMSLIEAIQLQTVMEMEPKMIYQDPLDRPTGGEPNCHPLTMSLHSSKKPDQSLPLSP